MKKNLLLVMAATVPAMLFSQTYCTPPPFTTGPFTGITNVTIGTLNHNSSDSDGVSDFTSEEAPKLEKGSTYTMTVTTNHQIAGGTFSGNLFTHAWIDWNQDGDFEDKDENVYKVDDQYFGTFSNDVLIPSFAKTGITRMRVYNDMPNYEGHEYPHPCGYAEYPSNFLGHHGEAEDYNVEITGSPTGIADRSMLNESFNVFTNRSGQLEVIYQLDQQADVIIAVYNALGQQLTAYTFNEQTAGKQRLVVDELVSLGSPFLIVQLQANLQLVSKKVIR